MYEKEAASLLRFLKENRKKNNGRICLDKSQAGLALEAAQRALHNVQYLTHSGVPLELAERPRRAAFKIIEGSKEWQTKRGGGAQARRGTQTQTPPATANDVLYPDLIS